MSIFLPKFECDYLLSLTVCGRLQKGGSKGEDLPKVARYKSSSGLAYLRVNHGGKDSRHLHVDCTLGKYFKKHKPKIEHKKTETIKIINNVLGVNIDTSVVGFFKVPLDNLPDIGFVKPFCIERGSSKSRFKMTECAFSLSGLPVQKIKWFLEEEGKKTFVNIRIQGRRHTKVSEEYLVESFDWINKLFMVFIMGSEIDASKSIRNKS